MAWFRCIGQGGGQIITDIFVKVTSVNTSSTSPSIKLGYYEQGELVEETSPIVSTTVPSSNPYEFHFVKVYFASSYWYVVALSSVEADNKKFIKDDVVSKFGWNASKNFNINKLDDYIQYTDQVFVKYQDASPVTAEIVLDQDPDIIEYCISNADMIAGSGNYYGAYKQITKSKLAVSIKQTSSDSYVQLADDEYELDCIQHSSISYEYKIYGLPLGIYAVKVVFTDVYRVGVCVFYKRRSQLPEPEKVFITQLNDILTAQDLTKATSSSESGIGQDGHTWNAFDGVKTGTEPQCWIPTYGATDNWLCYHFSTPKHIYECRLYFYHNTGNAYTGSVKIQGSNDGTNWNDISDPVALNMPTQGLFDYTVICNDFVNAYSYVRMFSADALAVYGVSAIGTLEFEIFGAINGMDNNPYENVLFKNGQWYNQDKVKIGTHLATISNGSLVFNGLNAGLLIEELNLPSDFGTYTLILSLRCGTGGAFVQSGTCSPNLVADTALTGIIQSGSNRVTYNNDSFNANTKFCFLLTPASNKNNSVFIGDATAPSGTPKEYYIDEIKYIIDDGNSVVFRS